MQKLQSIDEFFESVARAAQSVLLLDYDGTIAPFSPVRERARPYPGVIECLQSLVSSGRSRLIMITGRDARQIPKLLPLHPSPEVWGVHGLQHLHSDGTLEMTEIPLAADRGLREAAEWLREQGLQTLTEVKPGSVALHWRSLEPESIAMLRPKIAAAWDAMVRQGLLKILEFDGGIELLLARGDKGRAVQSILSQIGDAVPLAYLGDDTTDEAAFRALSGRGFTALVRALPRPTAAQAYLKTPEQLLEFLARWQEVTDSDAQLCSRVSESSGRIDAHD